MIEETDARFEGAVDRDGVRVGYQVFGDGPRGLLLLPTWPIVHSDFWRLQVPHLADRYTVVAFDGRGNGASDRPLDPASYSTRISVDDGIAVMDACGLDRAAVLSVSLGAEWAAVLAAEHPERVSASIFTRGHAYRDGVDRACSRARFTRLPCRFSCRDRSSSPQSLLKRVKTRPPAF